VGAQARGVTDPPGLAAESGVSLSAIREQEQGVVAPSAAEREKLEEALGVLGRAEEVRPLGSLRAMMLDRGRWERSQGIAEAGELAKQAMEAALYLGLESLRRIREEGESRGGVAERGLEWSALLLTLRVLRGWSQEELAAASGVSSGAISRQESGRRPARAIREKLERALGVEGKTERIEFYLGELRATMRSRHRRSDNPVVAEAGEAARRSTESALRAGISELRGKGEPRAPRAE
jgi:transcriptional regulator with XRE-family HTH domain